MKIITFLVVVTKLIVDTTTAFVAPRPLTASHVVATNAIAGDLDSMATERLDDIAKRLKLQVYDPDTSVYGFESKDPAYGIENIHTEINLDKDGHLGLTLTEVAHSEFDHRGLVLVSDVTHETLHSTPIHVGDTIIGVFAGENFKESTTGLDYDDTVDAINRAKEHWTGGSITLELNRLVKRNAVKVVMEDGSGQTTEIDALAGDNLRLLLLHHHVDLYDGSFHRLDQPHLTGDCGGEGICGTCLISVLEGMRHLNKIGPQESSLLTGRPDTWRAACKTVVGADNQKDTTLRIRLHPHNMDTEPLRP